MRVLLRISALLDGILGLFGRIGAWCGALLVLAVCLGVVTRYFGLPRPFGWNATQLQELAYWLHTFLFTLMIGWAYLRSAHVRIDLVRELLPIRVKYIIEMVGAAVLLLGYASLGAWYSAGYAYASFASGETSRAAVGLSHIWILKSAIVVMFVLMGLAAISQFIKALAGLLGRLPDDQVAETLGVNR